MNLEEKRLKIINLIKERSPFDQAQTDRIIKTYFQNTRTAVKLAIERHQLNEKKVLDIGCAYGGSLLYWREDSEGIEIQDSMFNFLTSLGKKVHNFNIEDGFQKLQKESYDAIYCTAVIEHLISPHLFLMHLHSLLKPDGLLILGYPLVPPPIFQPIWKRILGFEGWLDASHLYFFTPETSRLILERAGFKIIKQYSTPFYRLPIIKKYTHLFLPISMSCLSVCKRINNFKYYPKRESLFDPIWAPELKRFH